MKNNIDQNINNDTEKFDDINLLQYLKELHGIHTSMISFIIRQNSDLNLERKKIDLEIKTAVNIKDKNNRQNVITSLKAIKEKLNLYKKCPDNGLCIFSGIYYNKNKEIFEIHELIPPLPIKISTYLCDKLFHIELIEKLYDSYDDYGIVLIGGEESLFYKFHGNHYTNIDKINIHRQKNQKKGGQSAPRFGRIREGQILEYTKLIIERLIKNYVDNNLNKLNIKGLIVAGNDIKDKVVSDESLPPLIHNNIIKLMTINNLDIEHVIIESLDVINKDSSNTDKYLFEFFEHLRKSNSNIVYGMNDTRKKLCENMIKILFINFEIYENIKSDIDLEISHSRCEFIIVNQFNKLYKSFKDMGGIGGILWYGNLDYDITDNTNEYVFDDMETIV